jgi:hypothetical protein
MSIYAQFDEDGDQVQIASNTGWSKFGNWAESLENCPLILHLWEKGNCIDLSGLAGELPIAMKQKPPSRGVTESIKALLKSLRRNSKAAILLITN